MSFAAIVTSLELKLANSGKTSIIDTRVIRKRLARIGRNKSVRTHGVPGEFMKLSGEAMTPYLARLLEIPLNNATIPRDSKTATGFPICKGGYRLALSKF